MRILRIHLLVFSSFFVLCESSFNLHPCVKNPCQNDGVCNRQGALYVCMCAQNYTGVNCEINSGNRDRRFLEIEPLKIKRAINSEITRQNVLTTNLGINQTVSEISTTVEVHNQNKTATTTEESVADENETVSNKNVTGISDLNLTEFVSTENILNETVSNETETVRSENLNVTTPVSSENKTKENVTINATEKILTQKDLLTNRPAIVSVTTQTTARINFTPTGKINQHVTSNQTEKVGKLSTSEQNVTTSIPVIERELTTLKTERENKTSQVASPTKETGIHSITTTKTLTTRNHITNKTTILLLTTLEPTTKSSIKIPITSITTERTTKNFTALGAHNDTLVHVSAAVTSTTTVSPTTNTSDTTTVPKKSSSNKLVVILVPIFACLLVIVVIIGTALFIRSARKKRATRGTYSPSRQEIYGAPRDLGDILKPPPEERLI